MLKLRYERSQKKLNLPVLSTSSPWLQKRALEVFVSSACYKSTEIHISIRAERIKLNRFFKNWANLGLTLHTFFQNLLHSFLVCIFIFKGLSYVNLRKKNIGLSTVFGRPEKHFQITVDFLLSQWLFSTVNGFELGYIFATHVSGEDIWKLPSYWSA